MTTRICSFRFRSSSSMLEFEISWAIWQQSPDDRRQSAAASLKNQLTSSFDSEVWHPWSRPVATRPGLPDGGRCDLAKKNKMVENKFSFCTLWVPLLDMLASREWGDLNLRIRRLEDPKSWLLISRCFSSSPKCAPSLLARSAVTAPRCRRRLLLMLVSLAH